MVYNKDGEPLTKVYNRSGAELSQCYDADGNPLIDSEPTVYERFSVLGDSYSALQGFVTPATNAVWYPADGNDVDTESEMWWYQFGKGLGVDVDTINAFSGSRIGNDTSWGIENCFIARAENIGNPDIILVMGGTNDVWNGVSQGEYVYSNWTDNDLKTFRGALAYLLNYLLATYTAKIVFLCNTINSALSPDAEHYPLGYPYYESAHTICEHYNIDVVDFKVDCVGNHPTAYGMKQINRLLMNYFGILPEPIDTITTNATFPITATWNPNQNVLTLSKALKQKTLYRIDATITSYSSDKAYIQIQTNGTITAQFANFSGHVGDTGNISVYVWNSANADGVTSISVSCNKGSESSNQTAIVSDLKIYEVAYNT